MPDKKITAFCADTAPTTDDLLVSVNAPGGCPVNKKITISNLFILLDTNTRTWTNKSMDGACNTFTNIPNSALTTNPLARANHTGTQLLSTISDVTITAANINILDDGVNTTLHFHNVDRARACHTGTQTASTISDFCATVTCNAAVVANTAKVTNATHTGDVTGCSALVIAANVIVNADINTCAAIEHSKLESIVVATNQVNTYTAGATQIFTHSASLAGLRVVEIAGNPTCQIDGDIWLNLTCNILFARINGANVDLGAGAGGGEANLIASLGGGTVLTAAVPKCGVTLRTVSIATTAPIAHSVTACLLTFTLNGLVNADLSGSAAITFANLQNITTARLLGRQTAASGVIEEISLNSTLELVAATTLQRAALTGDVTASAGSNTTVIGAGVIVNADVNNCAAILITKTTGTVANFNTALSDGTFAFIGVANVWGTVNQNIAATGKWQEAGVSISPIGVHDVWVGAASLIPSTTAGSAAIAQTEIASGVDINTLNFDSGCTVERAQGEFSLPRNYNNGTVTYTIYWSSTAVDTDGVTWGVEGVAISDNTVINTAYGTRIDVDDANQSAASEVLISVESAALTLGNTPVDGDLVRFLISRQTGDANDIAVEDARLHGIMFHITTDAAVAA